MPSVKVTTSSASVELEANEISAEALCERALKTLKQAHEIEQGANLARAERAGGGYL